MLLHCSGKKEFADLNPDDYGAFGGLYHGRLAVCLLQVKHSSGKTERAETPRSRWRPD